jgi:hypothetical protein
MHCCHNRQDIVWWAQLGAKTARERVVLCSLILLPAEDVLPRPRLGPGLFVVIVVLGLVDPAYR